MKKLAFIFAIALLATGAFAQHFAVGVYQGWTPAQASEEMLDDGVSPDAAAGDGIFTITITDAASGERECKSTGPGGWGDNEVPNSGNYLYEIGAPGTVTLFLDTNSAGDGWLPDANRFSSDAPFASWSSVVATGDWVAAAGLGNDWDPPTAPALTDDGSDPNDTASDGIYTLTVSVPTAGTYQWKALLDQATYAWTRAIADVGFTTGGGNLGFTTTLSPEIVILEIDTNNMLARGTATGIVPVELSVFTQN